MSPVEICGIPYFSQMNLACVPFPAPGGPSKIKRMSPPVIEPTEPDATRPGTGRLMHYCTTDYAFLANQACMLAASSGVSTPGTGM